MDVYEIKYKLKKGNMNKGEIYYCNVVSNGIDHIIKGFDDKGGHKNYEIIDGNYISPIHGVDPEIKHIIINYEINNVMSKLSKKTDEKLHQLQTLQKQLKEKKVEWYDIDRILNDGREMEKENQIGDQKKYEKK